MKQQRPVQQQGRQQQNTSTTDLVEVGVEAGWEAIGGIIGDWTCAIHNFGKQYDGDDNDDGDDDVSR